MHIILYVVDALRADHLSFYGYSRRTTASFDQLASEGILFQDAFAPATWTRPVAASLITGLYPLVHKVRQRDHVLDEAIPRLPTQLRDQGWHTVAFSAMSNVSTATGFATGFDKFFDLYLDAKLVEKRRRTNVRDEDFRINDEANDIALPWAEDLTEKFVEWHRTWPEKDGTQPFFAFFWAIDPHIPYDSPDAFKVFNDPEYSGSVDGSRESLARIKTVADRRQLRDLYDNQILYNDHAFGELISYLKQNDLYDSSLIVVVGDHGEAFWEHGQFGHGLQPHDELLRVPLIVKLPEQAYAGTFIKSLVSSVDIFATILDAAGVDMSKGTHTQSRSLIPLITENEEATHQAVFSETQPTRLHPQHLSVRSAEWKYITTNAANTERKSRLKEIWHQLVRRGLWKRVLRQPLHYGQRFRYHSEDQLYNLISDPNEQKNILREQPEMALALQQELHNWIKECESLAADMQTMSQQSALDARTWEHLRALGYVE